MAIINTFCDPTAGGLNQSVRADNSGATFAGTFNGTANSSAILGGLLSGAPTNFVAGDLSVILMGDTNTINTFGAAPVNSCYAIIGNGCRNIVSGHYSNIFNGDTNFICGQFSTVINGQNNHIGDTTSGTTPSDFGVIAGGHGNCIDPGVNCATISGGCNNAASQSGSFVGGGDSNVAGGLCAAIGGGQDNHANCSYSSVFGGTNNRATGNADFIGGGDSNTMNGNLGLANCSSIVGGQANNIGFIGAGVPASYSFIGGGFTNSIFGVASSIVGGDTNTIQTALPGLVVNCSVIVGGCKNVICDNGVVTADLSFIGGGELNFVIGCGGVVVGGGGNCAVGAGSFVGGGGSNCAVGDASFAGGGAVNVAAGAESGIVSGAQNQANAQHTFVGAGQTNIINACSCASFIGAGLSNQIGEVTNPLSCGSLRSFIGGGFNNCIDTDLVNNTGCNTIGGGSNNFICARINHASIFGGFSHIVAGNNSSVGSGDTNFIGYSSDCSFIGGGNLNKIGAVAGGGAGATFSFIGGGYNNCIDDSAGFASSFSSIVGGCSNHITCDGYYSVIAGGGSNSITNGGFYNSILGGLNNQIVASCFGYIGVGENNTIVGVCDSYVGGGGSNTVSGGWWAAIGAGQNNCITTPNNSAHNEFSGIFSGCCNSVYTFFGSFIGGGGCNYIGNHGPIPNNNIADFGVIGGGQGNQINSDTADTPYGVIGGGQGNFICAGVNHGSILGGFNNCVLGACSAILGGSGNNDGGFPYTGIFGNGLIPPFAVPGAPSSFWVDQLVMPNIVVDTTGALWAGLPPGTLYTNVAGPGAWGTRPVFVK